MSRLLRARNAMTSSNESPRLGDVKIRAKSSEGEENAWVLGYVPLMFPTTNIQPH